MQSSKPSKKARTNAEETVAAAPESGNATAEITSKPRTSKSSTSSTKKKTTSETGGAKHRKPSTAEAFQSPVMDSPVIDPVGVMTPSPEAQEVTHAHIAKLAYSYWIARDYAHGSAEDDWHRAERELKKKR